MQNLTNFSTQNISVESQYLIQNLSIDQQFIIAQTLVSLFSIAFAIFFGVASLSNSKLNYNKFATVEDFLHYFKKSTNRISHRLIFFMPYLQFILYSTSLVFFSISFLSLIYFKTGNVNILKLALDLGVYSITFVLLFIGFLGVISFISAKSWNEKKIETLLEYVSTGKEQKEEKQEEEEQEEEEQEHPP